VPRNVGQKQDGPSKVLVSVVEIQQETLLGVELAGLSRAARTERLLQAASNACLEDRAALLEQVIEINMPVAAQLASRYAQRGVSIEDLQQVAYLALVKAARRYKHGPDRNFLAYAVPTIRGELRKYFRDLGWTVRPSRRIQETQGRICAFEDELCQKLGRAPRPSEIAEYLGLDLEIVIEALSANGLFQPSSLDAGPTADATIGGQLGIEETGFGAAEARAALAPVLARVSERERTLLEMRFWRGATQTEIGAVIGVTQMQVSRLLSKLMERLRDEMLTNEPTCDQDLA
jgi:RNA polymerase sigma-B factor